MRALRWTIVALAALVAGWMVFDGSRALIAGDYVTPSSGEYAGRLGPWADVVSALGIEPRSTGMKLFFVAYGLAWLAIVVAFVRRRAWASKAMAIAAAGSLWYLAIGTVASAIQLALLALLRSRRSDSPEPRNP